MQVGKPELVLVNLRVPEAPLSRAWIFSHAITSKLEHWQVTKIDNCNISQKPNVFD